VHWFQRFNFKAIDISRAYVLWLSKLMALTLFELIYLNSGEKLQPVFLAGIQHVCPSATSCTDWFPDSLMFLGETHDARISCFLSPDIVSDVHFTAQERYTLASLLRIRRNQSSYKTLEVPLIMHDQQNYS
jgi:hypothetical protein